TIGRSPEPLDGRYNGREAPGPQLFTQLRRKLGRNQRLAHARVRGRLSFEGGTVRSESVTPTVTTQGERRDKEEAMSRASRKSSLSLFGLKCRELRLARGLSLADQSNGMKMLPSEISGVEAGDVAPTADYITRFGAWLKLDALELSKFKVFARHGDNVVSF